MTYKYLIYTDKEKYESNSRNAIKHLKERNALLVDVFSNTSEPKLLCSAVQRNCHDGYVVYMRGVAIR